MKINFYNYLNIYTFTGSQSTDRIANEKQPENMEKKPQKWKILRENDLNSNYLNYPILCAFNH